MTQASGSILTIGHSSHSLEYFFDLILSHGVTALADVRSVPFSRFNAQFNREVFEHALKMHGIKYVFLGKELGGRSADKSCYENGRVQYRRLAETQIFRSGIQRLTEGAAQYRIALMCAEKEPLNCHRTLLVGRVLHEKGIIVEHIHSDGRVEPHQSAMSRLLNLFDVRHEDLFQSREELIAHVINKQEEKIAFVDHIAGNMTEDSL